MDADDRSLMTPEKAAAYLGLDIVQGASLIRGLCDQGKIKNVIPKGQRRGKTGQMVYRIPKADLDLLKEAMG
jgi:hypothetical protein